MRRSALIALVVGVFTLCSPAHAQFCPGAAPWVFDDVPAGDLFCGYITWAAQNGITLGCLIIDANHRLYCPNDGVTRSQMAAFVNRLGNVRVEAVGTGAGLTGGPITSVGTINLATTQLLPTTACTNGQIARWNGSAWACSTDANSGGTVTSVGSGTGLTGGPVTASGTLSIATGYQLPQSCTNGQVAKSNGAGGWTCASDATGTGTVTSITAGAGLTGGTITTSGTIAVDPASMTLTGDVSGTQAATVVGQVGGQTAANVAAGSAAANAAASANTSSTIVKRDASGNFAAGTITANLAGNAMTATTAATATANVLKAGDTMTGSLTLSSGDIVFPVEASTAAGGSIFKNGTAFLHNYGYQNVFLGIGAGNFSMSLSPGQASQNTGIGAYALRSVTTGLLNTAVGYLALGINTSGSYNTAVGFNALVQSRTGSKSTAVGRGSLYSSNGDDNTGLGHYALKSASSAAGNTAVGSSALESTNTGAQNTAVGYNAGNRAGAGTGYGGGAITFVSNTTGNYNTFLGYGTGATADVFNCTAVGIDAYCDAGDQVRLGNSFVNSIGGKVGWSALSDARAKEDIRELDLGLDFVLGLRPVSYRLKGGNGRTDMGFLAQDVEAALGDAYNVVDVGGDAERTLSLRYQDLVAPLVKAVQEQQETIRELRARLARLEVLLARER